MRCTDSHDSRAVDRGWEALVASGVLLFFAVKGTKDTSHRALIAKRLPLLEGGHWGALYTQVREAACRVGVTGT